MAGLKIIRAVIEDEVTRRVGPRYQPASEGGCLRWGQQPGYVVFAGQKGPVKCPRVRTRENWKVMPVCNTTGDGSVRCRACWTAMGSRNRA
jgi:hypothetical protein